MGLRKSKGNMYSWVTHTWNPIKGQCEHECTYCYMKRFKLKPVRLDKRNLRTNLGHKNFIFVGSSTDMWARKVQGVWIGDVLTQCEDYWNNQYLFQSKDPARFVDLEPILRPLKGRCVLGTTIESNIEYHDNIEISKAPKMIRRAWALNSMEAFGYETMVTIEPILKFDINDLVEIIKIAMPKWVNIGADSKGHGLPEPTWAEIEELVVQLEKFTTIREKHNLGRILDVAIEEAVKNASIASRCGHAASRAANLELIRLEEIRDAN